ncbi:MAG: hypothetical protein JWO36_122 [Myxococcales bacterium]|nr:hypothetical protein [Myxococcales bacterium]
MQARSWGTSRACSPRSTTRIWLGYRCGARAQGASSRPADRADELLARPATGCGGSPCWCRRRLGEDSRRQGHRRIDRARHTSGGTRDRRRPHRQAGGACASTEDPRRMRWEQVRGREATRNATNDASRKAAEIYTNEEVTVVDLAPERCRSLNDEGDGTHVDDRRSRLLLRVRPLQAAVHRRGASTKCSALAAVRKRASYATNTMSVPTPSRRVRADASWSSSAARSG